MILKKVIGRKDKASFPELNLEDIDVKIDTGAYTSAIHCHHIEEKIINGEKAIRFDLLDPSHEQYNNKEFSTKKYTIKKIKNSFGNSEKRFIITTIIILFGKSYPIELSLSERGDMKYPVLIGRKLLKGKFVVDSSKSDLSYKNIQLKIRYEKITKK